MMGDIFGVFPLGTAYLPGEKVVLRVFEPRYLDLMNDIEDSHDTFVSVLIAQGSEVGGGDRRFSHGVTIKAENIYAADFGLVVEGLAQHRVRVDRWSDDNSYPSGEIEFLEDVQPEQKTVHEAASLISLMAQRIRTLHVMLGLSDQDTAIPIVANGHLTTIAAGRWWGPGVSHGEVTRAFWTIAALVPCGPLDRYELLLPDTVLKRISLLRNTIEHVSEVIAFQQRN
jgi:hypothetical protein